MIRADLYLFHNHYAKSREAARKSIDAGLVTIDGKVIKKASEKIDESLYHTVEFKDPIPYVGRGGIKLEAALDSFSINPNGMLCIDIGASTGGFTDCLLQRGAMKVYAVDSGRDQLSPQLKINPRVISLEGVNARFLSKELICDIADLVVMDVSFISQTLILPRLKDFIKFDGSLVTLIKPQFECGRDAVGKGGIVKKPEYRLGAVRRVAYEASAIGLFLTDLIRSPIVGGDGNVEYLALFKLQQTNSIESIISKVDYGCQ